MKRAVVLSALIAIAALVTAGIAIAHHPPGGAAGSLVEPTFVAGKVSNACEGGQKLDGSEDGGPTGDIDSGMYQLFFPDLDGGSTVDLEIIVTQTSLGPTFTFISSSGEVVTSMYVKGGPDGSNLYNYGAGGAQHDDGLHSPVNSKNGKYYGLSHICVFADKL